MTENNEQKYTTESKEQKKAILKSKLQAKINLKKVGRMNNKHRQQQIDGCMKKMGITTEQANQMKEMFQKQLNK